VQPSACVFLLFLISFMSGRLFYEIEKKEKIDSRVEDSKKLRVFRCVYL